MDLHQKYPGFQNSFGKTQKHGGAQPIIATFMACNEEATGNEIGKGCNLKGDKILPGLTAEIAHAIAPAASASQPWVTMP